MEGWRKSRAEGGFGRGISTRKNGADARSLAASLVAVAESQQLALALRPVDVRVRLSAASLHSHVPRMLASSAMVRRVRNSATVSTGAGNG